MGRSRRVTTLADGDQSNKSKRRKTTPNIETLPTIASTAGKDVSEEVRDGSGHVALYHCNYCSKDLSSTIRIKCAVCPDFDLCVECFSVGVELFPHKCNHPYRVMDNLSFPLICLDWNADEEILLLEGIQMYGFGNWTEVSEHVGNKTRSQCIDHYNAIYMNSPCFPVPDMSHVMGKSREELLEMAKGQEGKKEFSRPEEHTVKEEPASSAGFKSTGPRKEDLPSLPSSFKDAGGARTASGEVQPRDSIKVEEPQSDRSVGEKKPRVSGEMGPSMTELSGYNFKRQEFEVEYDNDAEQLLADMEFKDTDTEAEHELKLRVLRIYAKRLDERKRRKDFILERNLLYRDPFEKILSPEEKEIYQRHKVFMRFHSKEEHEELIRSVIEEHRMVKRLQDLQEARAAGCQLATEANLFIEKKRMKEAEEMSQRTKDSVQAGPSGKVQLKASHDISPRGVARGPAGLQPFSRESLSGVVREAIVSWDVSGFPGANLLSESEIRLCNEMRILPAQYLSMLQRLSMEITKGTVTNKSDAHGLFKVDPSKVDRLYDVLVKRGIAHS